MDKKDENATNPRVIEVIEGDILKVKRVEVDPLTDDDLKNLRAVGGTYSTFNCPTTAHCPTTSGCPPQTIRARLERDEE